LATARLIDQLIDINTASRDELKLFLASVPPLESTGRLVRIGQHFEHFPRLKGCARGKDEVSFKTWNLQSVSKSRKSIMIRIVNVLSYWGEN
jgi:hypothetical protein